MRGRRKDEGSRVLLHHLEFETGWVFSAMKASKFTPFSFFRPSISSFLLPPEAGFVICQLVEFLARDNVHLAFGAGEAEPADLHDFPKSSFSLYILKSFLAH